MGVMPAAVRVLSADAKSPLCVLEAAVGCADGRTAVCESTGQMDGADAAVSLLWAVCHLFQD